MISKKSVFLILGIIALILIVYLNRAYSYMYSYNDSASLIRTDIQRRYTLEGGKGEKKIKYVALGDSLTYGFGAKTYTGTYPYIFGKKLLNKYQSIAIVNLAVSGAVVDDVISTQLPQLIDEKPDFVSILIGINDVHNFSGKQKFKSKLENIINKLKENPQTQILLINIPYLNSGLILPPYDKIIDSKAREFNLVIYDVASSMNIKHFDLYSSSKDYFKEDPALYSLDKFHPSEKGYILWGNLINAD